jgi:hypothetical protein
MVINVSEVHAAPVIVLMMEAVCTSETLVNINYIPISKYRT